jgi:Na+-transporting methylmalonyl-CoA/oxaloacetate decarboxylase gamma subunit
MNKTLTIVVVALVVLAVLVYFMSGEDDAVNQAADETSEMTQEESTQADAAVSAEETPTNATPANSVQLAAAETGMKATVDSATLSQPGYVVVYRVNSQNDTEVIGSSDLLAAGDYSDITIQLDSGIAKDQTIVAVLHADDGDGEFEFPGSDGYLNDADQSIYSDVDIVDVDVADESEELSENVEAFLAEEAESN